jgi:hypothetical protein
MKHPVDRDTAHPSVRSGERHSVDDARRKLRAAFHRGLHERPGEAQRVDLGGRLGAADHLVGDHVAVEPLRVR